MILGIDSAYKSIKKNVDVAMNTIVAIPMEVYEKSGTHVNALRH
jgi:hypothetical protein